MKSPIKTFAFVLTLAVLVQPLAIAATNLIANPSVESANPSNANLPQYWAQNRSGTNTTAFTYLTSGQAGSRSVKVQMTSYTSGSASWNFSSVAITGGTKYIFSDYYQANVATQVVARFESSVSSVYTTVVLGSPSASSAWTPFTTTFTAPTWAKKLTIYHQIGKVGWLTADNFSLSTSAAQTPPTIVISSPTEAATVSGSVSITATVTSSTAITSVQFKLDGANLGSAVTTAPYTLAWNTIQTANGIHSLTAVVNAAAGQATSTAVNVNVNNQAATGNLVLNPSVEVVDPSNSAFPKSWRTGQWGTNTATFTYVASGGYSGSRSLRADVTAYTDGAVYWYPDVISVTPGQIYNFSNYYMSNVATEVDYGIIMSDGSEQSGYLGTPPASPNAWSRFSGQITVPAGAVGVRFYHLVRSVGWLVADEFALTQIQPLRRPLLTLTFDDGFLSFYQYGLSVLQKYALPSTAYIISGTMDTNSFYMTSAQVRQVKVLGHEIGSHTVSHPDLTTLAFDQMDAELKNSQTTLQNLLGVSVPNLATPYGSANGQVLNDAANYYSSVRSVREGFNAKGNFSRYEILVKNIFATTTLAEVQSWVQQAIATKTWLVLVYHQIDPTLTDKTAWPYNTLPSDLDAQLGYIKSSGIPVRTMQQALSEVIPQL